MHRKIFAVILAGVLSLLTLTACGKSQFGLTENTEKRMVITAERAAKDDFFLVGSLKVDEGEQITISSDLEKGSVRVEIFRWGEEQDADTLPETGGEATLTANLNAFEKVNGVKLNYKFVPRRAGDVVSIWADPTLANTEMGWKATRSIEETLKSAWEWELHLKNQQQ